MPFEQIPPTESGDNAPANTTKKVTEQEQAVTTADIEAVFHAMEPHVSTAKMRIESAKVLAYLQIEIDPRISEITFITGGENSQAFSFEKDGESFVIRVNSNDDGFMKDAYASTHFASVKLPVPEVTKVGKMENGYSICISRKAQGKGLDSFEHDALEPLMPHLMNMLDAIHETPIPEGRFGYFNGEGNAEHITWQDSLLSIETNDYFEWDKTIHETCMEPAVYETLLTQLKELAPHMPHERKLVHGDVGMDNALSDGKKITAVIDWGGAQFGDPLYDVVWLHMWWKKVPFADLYQKHCAQKGIVFEEYETRLKCYTTSIGLGALGFFAKSNQPQKYQWLKDRLMDIGILPSDS